MRQVDTPKPPGNQTEPNNKAASVALTAIDVERRSLIGSVLSVLAAASPVALLGCGGGKPSTSQLSVTLQATAATTVATTGVPASAKTSATVVPPEAAPSVSAVMPLDAPVWNPSRDSAGNVVQGDLDSLPLNTWYYVAGTGSTLNDVIETPHYLSNSGGDGSTGIVSAWGGAAWDYVNQRMLISGGGHVDTSAADVGIYALAAQTLKFTRVVNRQASTTPLKWNGTTLVAGEGWQNGTNVPLSTGYPGSMHTYDAIVWVPPATMATLGFTSNVNGGVFYPGSAKAVVNLDNGSCTALHWKKIGSDFDWSYCTAILDGTLIVGPHISFNFWRFSLGLSEYSDWPTIGGTTTLSSGKYLADTTSATQFVYNNKAFSWLRERREMVSFAGNQAATRVRYGQAIDASASDWTSYHDAISLASANGMDHLDFNGTNLQDTGTNLLCAAGAHYDHAADCIWVQANTAGGSLYKITGIAGSTWTVLKVAGIGALIAAGQGTFGRFRVATIGTTKIGIRVTGTATPLQVVRLS